jgi:hypothetical protein
MPNHYVGDLLHTMGISGLSRVRTELVHLAIVQPLTLESGSTISEGPMSTSRLDMSLRRVSLFSLVPIGYSFISNCPLRMNCPQVLQSPPQHSVRSKTMRTSGNRSEISRTPVLTDSGKSSSAGA